MTVPLLDPSIVVLQPTFAAAELAAQLGAPPPFDPATAAAVPTADAAFRLTQLVHGPAHDTDTRVRTQ